MHQNSSYQSFSLDSSAPSLWRVTFNHPPINLIDSVMIGELGELFRDVESRNDLGVIVFDSADPDYFLAHYDITDGNRSKVKSLPAGPTGFHPWLDVLVRLSRLPAVTISAIRGRARGAGSEFAIATDIRLASRERADEIEAGMVFVNGVLLDGAELPFGGIKRSGFGRELGRYGMDEFVIKKLIRRVR